MTLHTVFLWLYSAMASLVFGATVYEALVVHPAWSRKPPESFVAFMGTSTERRKNGLASRTSSSGSFAMRERRCSM